MQRVIQKEHSTSSAAPGGTPETVSEHTELSVDVDDAADGVFDVTVTVTSFTGQRELRQRVDGGAETQITVDEETVSWSHELTPVEERLPRAVPAVRLEATVPDQVHSVDIDHTVPDQPGTVQIVQEMDEQRSTVETLLEDRQPQRWFNAPPLQQPVIREEQDDIHTVTPVARYEEQAGIAALTDEGDDSLSRGPHPAAPSPVDRRPVDDIDGPVGDTYPVLTLHGRIGAPATTVETRHTVTAMYDEAGDVSRRLLMQQPDDLAAQSSVTALDVVEELAERGDVQLSVVEQPYPMGDGWVNAVQIGQAPGMDLDYLETYVGKPGGEPEIMQTTLDRYEMGDNEFVEIRESYSHGHTGAGGPSGEEMAAIQAAWDDEYRWFDDWQERSAYALFAEARQTGGSVVTAGAPYDTAEVPAARQAYIDDFGVAPEDDLDDVVYGRQTPQVSGTGADTVLPV